MSENLSQEIINDLKFIVEQCEREDRSIRDTQLRTWRRLKLFWEGFQRVWYSEVAHDWRVWNEIEDQNTDQAYYDKPINVFRAYLESIIAALSIIVPPIKCYPDDADNTLDLSTAKAGDKIAQLIYRHNDVSLLWLHALFVFITEGMTACYSYTKEDEKYGTYEDKEYDEVEEEHETTICPLCGYEDTREIMPGEAPPPTPEMQPNMGQAMPAPMPQVMPGQPQPQQNIGIDKLSGDELRNEERDEFQPDNEDVPIQDALINKNLDLCPSCMKQMDPEIKREKVIVTRLVGVTTKPKSRICLEAYGGLNVIVPNYARNQSECPYLIFSKEINYTMAIEEFEGLKGKTKADLIPALQPGMNNVGGYEQYDQWARLNPQYREAYPENVVTVKKAWLRPAVFNMVPEERADRLKKKFPNGAKVSFANSTFAEACNEALDDCWTLNYNPLADYVHYDPIGLLLVSIQDITNDLISLTLQTIEHGIGQTFADPAVLNFNAYEQTEVLPGGIFPATPKSGKGMGEGFYELKTASLSSEVLPFFQNIQSLAQLVSGALPSLFGGQVEGSGTASEYSMSRAQAQQRLQNIWKIQTSWWKNVFGKAIPMYIKEVKDDERVVERTDDGNFVNTFIRKAELEGKIGRVELEANENLPMTWAQQKDVIMQILNAANPQLLQILMAPENLPLIHDALGLTDFYVPGEDSVIKQYDEIKLLLDSGPMPNPNFGQLNPETGEPDDNQELPSVDIDPLMDNHQIEFEICRKWAQSEAGRQVKSENEAGYRNVLLHAKEHFITQQQQQMMQQQQLPPEQGAANGAKSNPTKTKEAPITGDSNVKTAQ